MLISARNQLSGSVVDIVRGATTSHVRIDLGSGIVVTASVSTRSVDDLALEPGSKVTTIIKASDVLIGVDG
jgi:molybdopterin-binding protein